MIVATGLENRVFTNRQAEEIRAFKRGELKRINIYDGSVRSGKTWISCVIWGFWLLGMNKKDRYLMIGKSLTSLQRNVLDVIVEIFGERNVSYNINSKVAYVFGRKVYLEGANDNRSESKIRGLTLAGAYCDEVSLFPEDFFKMLLSRLSVGGAKLFATTNPDNPNHWLMKNFIELAEEKRLSLRHVKFLIEDNTFLDREYIEALKREFSGVFYDRYILGLWKPAEGVIYREFADRYKEFLLGDLKEFGEIAFAQVGVDFGGRHSAHSFNLTGVSRDLKRFVTLDEWYFRGEISPLVLEEEFIKFLKKNCKFRITNVFCDSAEQVLISGFRKAVRDNKMGIGVKNARKGSIVGRIRFYNRLFAEGNYFIMSHCVNTVEAFRCAVYDEREGVLGDVRLDNGSYNVDSLDAQEYSTENLMGG